MMINRVIVSIVPAFVMLFSYSALSQDVSVSGTIPGGKSHELRLIKTDDYISMRQETIFRIKLDSTEYFEFSPSLEETTSFLLEIGHYSFSLFMERSGNYVIECDPISVSGEFRPFYYKEVLPAHVVSEPAPGLNGLIGNFNLQFNEFVISEFGGVYQRRNTAILSTFRDESMKEYESYGNSFLMDYIKYKIAMVELAMAPSKESSLFRTYLQNLPVQLNHPEYMNFFNSFFDQYLYPDNRFIKTRDLYATINYNPDIGSLLDTLGKDTTLRNEVIRELVCMKTLKQLYNSENFSGPSILKLLKELENTSKFKAHRNIAHNLFHEMTSLQKGFEPSPFELPDLDGNLVKLSDYQGKPLYVNFFVSWSSGCLVELELLKELFEEYKGQINFLSISLDNNVEVVRKLKAEKEYDWDFLYNGLEIDLINDYRIKTFPVFLLLDTEGKVYEYPAFKPSEVIRDSFMRLLSRE